MREIKFRVWDGFKMTYGGQGAEQTAAWVLAVCNANGLHPEQFTGLRDKNGVEIYEGDIVSPVTFLEGGVNGMAVVKYEDGGFSPFAVPGWEIVARHKEVTVIGNIHENKELLK